MTSKRFSPPDSSSYTSKYPSSTASLKGSQSDPPSHKTIHPTTPLPLLSKPVISDPEISEGVTTKASTSNPNFSQLGPVYECPLDKLIPYAGNARIHSKQQIAALARSITNFGFTNPVLIDETGLVLAGHGRLLAAQKLELKTVPTLCISHLSEQDKRAYILADNQLSERSHWDKDKLQIEMGALADFDLDFDLTLTGFEMAEIDQILGDKISFAPPQEPKQAQTSLPDPNSHSLSPHAASPAHTPEDAPHNNHISPSPYRPHTPPPDPDDQPLPASLAPQQTISQKGDLWLLGPHRLLCGDAKSAFDVNQLMQSFHKGGSDDRQSSEGKNPPRARLILTDPPYNVPINGHVCGSGSIRHQNFHEACGEMDREEFITFLIQSFGPAADYLKDGGLAYIFMDWRHMGEILSAGEQVFDQFKHLCVWAKTNGGMGSFYRSRHELIFIFKKGRAAHTNNIELGRYGRYRTNVWDYAGINSFGKDRDLNLSLHPTVKPTALLADAILDVTLRGDIVLDMFAGSGTTALAADRTGRRAALLEIDRAYCDVAIRRWQRRSGLNAHLLATGETYDQRAQNQPITPTTPCGLAQNPLHQNRSHQLATHAGPPSSNQHPHKRSRS